MVVGADDADGARPATARQGGGEGGIAGLAALVARLILTGDYV